MSKLYNIFILGICLIKALFFGRADKRIGVPKSVLIIQRAQIGDTICTTPMFSAIKKAHPTIRVLVGGKRSNAILLKNHPNIDEYIYFDENFFEALSYFKKRNIDFACIANPDFLGLAAAYLAGIKTISTPIVFDGYSPHETITYRILRHFVIRIPLTMGTYAPRDRLHLLEPIGIKTDDTKKILTFNDESVVKVEKWLNAHGLINGRLLIGISLSAGNKIKEWPVERFAEVVKYLIERHGADVVVVGSSQEIDKAKEFFSLISSPNVYDATGEFSLEELKAFIAKVSLFISVDTGPIYIAEAFSVPTIDILGPMDEREQPPVSAIHRVVFWKGRIAPAIHIMNTRVYDEKEVKRQIENITVEMVINEIDDLIYSAPFSKKRF